MNSRIPRFRYLALGITLALCAAVVAQDSVVPSRLRLFSLGVGTAAPSTTGNITASGTIRGNTDVTVNGVSVCRQNGTNCPGGATPGGSDTYVQYNDGGAFGGESAFTYDETNDRISIGSGGITSTGAIQVTSTNFIVNTAGQFLGRTNDTASNPGHSWNDDTNTGIYNNLDGQIDLSCNGGNCGNITATSATLANKGEMFRTSFARLTTTGAACNVNGSWQSANMGGGCSRSGTGVYIITFDTNYTTSPPVCTASQPAPTAGFATVNNSTISTVTVSSVNTSFALADNGSLDVVCVGR